MRILPSSVAYGATFPLKGEGYCTDLFCFYLSISDISISMNIDIQKLVALF